MLIRDEQALKLPSPIHEVDHTAALIFCVIRLSLVGP